MSIVEPIVGHLLSKYNETVIDGLAKIKSEAEADGAAAAAIIHSPQAMDALKSCAQRPELMEATLRAVCTLIRCCRASGEASSSATTSSSSPWSARCSEHSSRTHLIREFCRGASFAGLKKILATLADDSVPLTLAVLDFLTLAATYAPKLILARFGQQLPLNLACFRARLTYAQRRVRLARAQFLLAIVQSRFSTTSSEVMCAHGFISTLLGDVAELLLEGTTQGLEVGRAALDAFETYFLNARSITAAQKRATLMGQRSIFRLLVKALEYPPVAERAAELLHRVVLEMHESPADYASSRAEALDDRGMPNFILFFLLRQLRPRSSALSSRLLLFILHQAPDLIRPYYSRISSHLTEEVGESARSTSQVATINILTRIAMAPLPYHLQAERVRLREVSATVDSFYCMSPREVVDEIFPTWSAEYIHRMIKSSSNLLTLVLAMQATEAALTRARKVLAIIRNIQKRGGGRVRGTSSTDDEEKEHDALALVEEQLFAADPLSDWESFDANVVHLLLAALPRREEFWHRMTQQIHALMQEGGLATTNAVSTAKVQFITQRMMRLMVSYTDVFELRMPWISAVPTWLPTFEASTRPIADALQRGNDILATWEPSSIALLCQLLVSGLSSGVSMVKLHHITLSSSTQAGLTDWPLLLSVLLWATRHRGTSMERLTSLPLTMKNTLTWIARLLQWCVHGVSMQFGCELEEAMLWVLTLRAETIPCFLHMINSLLQRSLSKAADRVAEELFAGQSGILVAAANTFISKTAEKRAAAATTSSTTTSGGASNKNNNTKKEDLWSLDLQAHLTDFEAVVAEVVGHYAQRHTIAARLVGDVLAHQAETRKMEAAAQSSELLMMNATNISSSSSSRTLRGEMAPYLAPHDQVLFFSRNCRSPVQAATEIELEMQLQVGSSVLPLCRIKTDSSSSSSTSAAQSVEELVLHVVELPRLLASNAVCWELAGRVLSELSTALRAGASMLEKLVSLRTFCVKLLEHLHQFEAVVLSAQAEQRDAATAGLNMLVLVCVRTLLYTPFDMNDDDDDVSSSSAVATTACTSSIARIIMAAYTGSISANDRIRYAILLTIHYYRETAANKKKNDNTSDDPPSMYRGALVPQEVAEQRFLISSHFPVAHQTPEIDMLTALIDAWSVEEVQHMALHMPARLSNTVVCHRRGRPALDLLRAVFSEISSEEDLVVAPFATATSARIMDVRYLLPLLHTVLALPATTAPHRFVGARCLPILIRGLSCTEAALRTFAASALHAAYMPNGPTKIVASLARLKLIQLANKQRQHHHNTAATSTATSDDAVVVPRLPAPLSALLVVALKPLGLHSDALHAHLLHLFGDVHALFTSPVPLSSWLTAFPLGAINAPLMMEQQLEMQKNGMQQSSIAHESATKVLDDLRREEPPHLRVVLQLLQHGCSTNGDAAAIIQSESLEALMMLVDLVASSNDVRLRFMEVLVAVCRTSQAVALQLADEGHLLSWAISFAHQLCAEFGDTQPHKYEGPLFSAVLELIFILSSVFVSSTTSSSSSSSPSSPTPTRGAAPNPAAARQERQLQLHAMEEQLQLLSERLHEAHVSARSTHERMKHTLSLFSEGVAKFFERVEGEGRSYVPRPRNISSSMHTTPHRGGAQRYAARGRGSSSSSLHRPAGGQRRPREAAAERTSSRPAKKISRA